MFTAHRHDGFMSMGCEVGRKLDNVNENVNVVKSLSLLVDLIFDSFDILN